MVFIRKPIINQWYRHLDKGEEFQVVAVDENERTVEIQHFDGDVEEIGLEDWRVLNIEPIEPPEDWTGPMDDIERDDLGYTETGVEDEDWSGLSREELARRLAKREEAEGSEGEEEQP